MKIAFKLNFRLIAIHLLASLFLLIAAKRFALLYDFEFVESLYKYGYPEFIKHLHTENDTITMGERMATTILAIAIANLIALVTSFSYSLFISIKRKAFWLNSFLVLLICYSINILSLLDISIIKSTTNIVGNIFISYGLKYAIIINGIFNLLISVFLFFNKRIIRFIFMQKIT